MRYGPSVEIAVDSPEATSASSDRSTEDIRHTKEAIERILREAQGSRVPVEAVLDALFPPLVWREGGRVFKQVR